MQIRWRWLPCGSTTRLLLGVHVIGIVLLCANFQLLLAREWWELMAAAAVIAPLLAALVTAMQHDSQLRCKDAAASIKNLDETAKAARKLAARLQEFGLRRLWQLVSAIHLKLLIAAGKGAPIVARYGQ